MKGAVSKIIQYSVIFIRFDNAKERIFEAFSGNFLVKMYDECIFDQAIDRAISFC